MNIHVLMRRDGQVGTAELSLEHLQKALRSTDVRIAAVVATKQHGDAEHHFLSGLCVGLGLPLLDEIPDLRTLQHHGTAVHLSAAVGSLAEALASPAATKELLFRARHALNDLDPERWVWSLPAQGLANIICADVPAEITPFWADPAYRDYIRIHSFADADAVLEISRYLSKRYPHLEVTERKVSECSPADLQRNLILVGGLSDLTREFSDKLKLPYTQVSSPEGVPDYFLDERGEPLGPTVQTPSPPPSDVAIFSRMPNPTQDDCVCIILNGVLTYGVRGAALAFIDRQYGVSNSGWIRQLVGENNRFYSVCFNVPIFNSQVTAPDFTQPNTIVSVHIYDEPSGTFHEVHGSWK